MLRHISIHSPVLQTVVLSARLILPTSSLASGTSPCCESIRSMSAYFVIRSIVLVSSSRIMTATDCIMHLADESSASNIFACTIKALMLCILLISIPI